MNDLLSYETARVLQIVLGNKVFNGTKHVYEYHSKELHKRSEAKFSELLFINCPSGADVLNIIPHTIQDRDSCLNISKFHTSWRVFYMTNVGSVSRDVRMSASFHGNNLAEALAKLWLDTCQIDISVYDQPSVLVNLLDYCYPGSSIVQINDQYVQYCIDGDIRVVHKLSLAKNALIKYKAI